MKGGDLLDGVKVIKGSWADGSPLVAVPNFARCNRFEGAGNSTAGGGDSSVNYAPGWSGGSGTKNTPAASSPNRRRGFGPAGSLVWIKDTTTTAGAP